MTFFPTEKNQQTFNKANSAADNIFPSTELHFSIFTEVPAPVHSHFPPLQYIQGGNTEKNHPH